MGKEKPVFEDPIIIQYRGLYDYDGLIAFLRGYLMNLKPNIYKEPKFKYKTGKTGTEVEFEFGAIRNVTHYVRISFTLKGHAWDMNRKDIDVNGQKKTLSGGKIELQLSGKFQVDYPGIFDASAAAKNKKLIAWMDKLLNEEQPAGLLYEDTKATGKKFATETLRDFDAKIKSFLKMECY